jgi:hypothetical protein
VPFSLSAPPRDRVRIAWRCALEPDWRFDLEAIERAADSLGLERPIEIGCIEGRRRTDGRHRTDKGAHRISVRRTLSAGEASRTIWHELAHAQQGERIGPDFYGPHGAYERAMPGRGHAAYLANPYEIEARRMEARHNAHPLTTKEPR